MDHLSPAELNDYARGLLRVVPERSLHIANCAPCSEQLSFLRKVSEAAFAVEVPDDAVQQAKEIFRGVQPASQGNRLRQAVARLVFLNAGGLQLADLRTSRPAARQALFQYGDYCIDLRTEGAPQSARISLVGQIADETSPLIPVANAPVWLFSGKRVKAKTKCNSLGEFAMDFVGGRDLRLQIQLPQTELAIELPLRDLNPEE
jgi:hypothetical protein